MDLMERFKAAADVVGKARAIIIAAGAGMGVDSGLPDFRGERGFWKAYPMYERLGISFSGAANPSHFDRDPSFAWGFYGHRTNLYRETTPHAGFAVLLDWCGRFGLDPFVVTSNVDGQFQKAGFPEEKLLEVHGSIHWLQCTGPCTSDIWQNRETITVDTSSMRALSIPGCIRCKAVARPNILMFGDWTWISDRTAEQERRLEEFVRGLEGKRVVVIEMGAGAAIPTVRHTSERLGRRLGAVVIRINPREGEIASPHISLPCGALEGIKGIEATLSR
jgi:NAD-dependent SIR2 family protein deacetylase